MSELKHPSTLRGLGGSSFGETLQELKRHGCNVLVCGGVPRSDIRHLSARLLGGSTEPNNVTQVFGLFDQDVTSVHGRLALIDGDLSGAHVITTDGEMRSTTTAGPSAPGAHSLNVTTVSRDLERFEVALHQAIDEFGDRDEDSGGKALRVCIDSLQPLFAEYDAERVDAFLFDLDETVGVNRCMTHSILPVAYDAPIVKRITPHFDIVMSLRVAEGNSVQQQWRLVASDYWTDWIPIRLDPIETSTPRSK